MTYNQFFETKFSYLGKDLLREILASSDYREFDKGTVLMREGQYIKVIPIVIHGLVKVSTQVEEKELLLYYIKPEQSCIISFSSCLKNEQSTVFAMAEEETSILLIPSDKIARWVTEYPIINKLFYEQFDLRYSELIDTINHLLYHKLDKRIFDYLAEKTKITGKNPIKITHKEIAMELGTAREVVSRIIKKLEKSNKLKQHHDSIEIF